MKLALSVTPDQQSIIQHPSRIKVLLAGRRWGKSVLMAYYALMVSLQRPGTKVWFVGKSYRRSLSQMRMMKKNPNFMRFVKHTYVQFPPRFDMKNGGTIEFLSADRPDDLRGEGIVLILFDEAAYIPKRVFQEILLPMISDTRGTILAGSTANGRNYFWDLVQDGKKPDQNRIKSWILPSSTGLAFQGDEGRAELEQLKQVLPPAVYAQEYECEPLAGTDAVFRFVDRVVGGSPVWSPEHGRHYVIGLDIGKTRDHTAIIVLEIETGRVVYSEIFPLGVEHAEQAKRVREIQIRYRECMVVIDSTGGASGGHEDSYVKFYKERIPNLREFWWNRGNKQRIINHLALEIEQARFKIPSQYVEVLNQLKIYRYWIGERSLFPHYGAPSGEHDDAVAALAQAVWARAQGWVSTGQGTPLSAAF